MTRGFLRVRGQLVSLNCILFSGGGALIFVSPGFINPVVYNAFHSVDRVFVIPL
jgi:hypothetical protein